MGGIWVNEKTERFLIEVRESLIKSDRKIPSASKVLGAAKAKLEREKIPGIILPKVRKVQMILAEFKPTDEENKLDKPWSGLMDEYQLPPESVPYVLQAWRYVENLGEKLTVREAKWCSILYSLFKNSDISRLCFESARYAHEEKLRILFSVHGQTAPNTDMDSSLVMGNWERETDSAGSFMGFSRGGVSSMVMMPRANDGGIAEEFIHAIPDINYETQSKEVRDRLEKIHSFVNELTASSKLFPNLESRMVYLRHLSYLCKMPKWDILSPEEIRDLIVDLRKWVLDMNEHREKIDINTAMPREIYKRVGWVYKRAD
jgi:hypothetical protein